MTDALPYLAMIALFGGAYCLAWWLDRVDPIPGKPSDHTEGRG